MSWNRFNLAVVAAFIPLLYACTSSSTRSIAGPSAEPVGQGKPKRARGVDQPLVVNPMPVFIANQNSNVAAIHVDKQRVDPPRPHGFSVEPALSGYHKDGVDHLVLGWHHFGPGAMRDTSHLGTAVSHNSGQSWQIQIIDRVRNLGSIQYDPFTAADVTSQTLWLGALAIRSFSGEPPNIVQIGMYLASAQGINALSAPTIIGTDGEDKPAAVFARNAQNPAGTLFIAAAAKHRRSNDLGQSIDTLANGEVGFFAFGHQPIIFPDGEVINIAVGFDPSFPATFPATITALNSPNLGTTLTPKRIVRSLNYVSLVTLDNAVPGRFRMAPFGQAALSPNGRLYYVFPEIVSEQFGERNVDVLMIHSDDRGLNWSAPVVINGDSTPARDQFMPAMTISSDGTLHIVYADTRRSQQADGNATAAIDFVYSSSRDGGNSFSEVFLTDAPSDVSELAWRPYENAQPQYYIGDYVAISAPTPSILYIAHPVRVQSDPSQLGLTVSTLRLNDTLFDDGFEQDLSLARRP
jgi:hypothetical protein